MIDSQHSEREVWYNIQSVENIDTPALVVYLDRIEANIRTVIATIGDTARLRPHAKTHKSPAVTRLLLNAGITKFKCATIAEAEMLGAAGAPDVLLAYQPVGPKAVRLVELAQRYPSTQFSCLIDSAKAAEALSIVLTQHDIELPVFIDLNAGMNRTGINPDQNAVALFEQVAKMKALKPVGLHAYDGHIVDHDLAVRVEKVQQAFAPVMQLKKSLREKGFPNITIVAGGSPTFPVHAKNGEVECSPGTFVYWDAGYQQAYPEQGFQPAALLLSRVISLPGNSLVCTDLGHKSVAAENPLPRRVHFLNADDVEFVGQSEEHLLLRNRGSRSLNIGDVLYGLPVHVCPTCALYERAFVVQGEKLIGEWKTVARDRKINV